MEDEPETRPHARARLQDTPETAERFHAYGLNEYPHWRIGVEEGVHRNTVLDFLKRAPASRGRFEEGKSEARRRRKEARLAGLAPGAAAGRLAPGETCPTCGRGAGQSDETVTFTTAELADGRKRFENLIDRYLSARGASLGEDERR